MSLISIENVSKTYYEKVVLSDVNLQINRGEKLGIVGENGSGKTTLFRLITGLEKPDSENAKITIARNTIVGYLKQELNSDSDNRDALFDPQIFKLEQKLTILEQKIAQTQNSISADQHQQLLNQYSTTTAKFESLDGYSYKYRMQEILAGLGIDPKTARRALNELSGGERMRVELARILIREPDLMLLDEPTNHLDYLAIEWLEDFLKTTKSAVLVVSHDRLFLDQIATDTAELSGGKLKVYPGNYSNFVRLKSEQEKSLNKAINKLENDLTRQTEISKTMFSHRKISSYHSSIKKAKRLSEKLNDLKTMRSINPKHLNIKISKEQDLGDPNRILIKTEDLYVEFPNTDSPLFLPFSWTLQGKEKVVIVGPNGCGKTSIIKSILGIEENAKGKVEFAKDIKYGFLGQFVEFSDESQRVIDSLSEVQQNWTEGRLRNELAKYGFRDIDVFKPLNILSGGERSRLYLCQLLSNNPDILFLDEPTNHLDINSCEILEKAIMEYEGAIIAVSHDRYFIDKIAQYILGFINKEIIRFNNYRSFRKAESQVLQNQKEKFEVNVSDSELKKTGNLEQASADSESDQKNNLWTDQEIKAHQSLHQIKAMPNNQIQMRRFKALANKSVNELFLKLEIAEKKKEEFESTFETTTDPEIYHQYNQLLVLIEIYETIYLKLAELLESFT
ncbi:MAG: ribosomal protection-like ABC-F family protein [Saccharofermentanales bacterium]|jgi:ATP-binding cassette subfamily F protein 3|nr:ABC-F family ATP-binding cassette domain-containing protein [Bacillota bacterium]